MLASDSSDDGVTTSLLGKRTSSPSASMRSSKSVLSQVRDTLFSFVKRSRLDDVTNKDKEAATDQDSNTRSSASEKQRTLEFFTDRVKSFSTQNWMGKPLCLSPPLLAQYGWQCIGVDTLKCCSCCAVLCVRLPWPSEENYRQKCYEYRNKVLSAHMKICSWPSYPCPDSYISPFLHGVQGVAEVIIQFIEQRTNLLQLKSKLPKIDPRFLEEIGIDKKDVQTLALINGSVLQPSQPLENMDDPLADFSEIETASLLAMSGWDTTCTSLSRSPFLFCQSSGRSIGLHNFFALHEVAKRNESDSGEDCAASQLIDEGNGYFSTAPSSSPAADQASQSPLKRTKQHFHPLQQHSPWSHWVVSLSPISKVEFVDKVDANESVISSQTDDKYRYVINPLIIDAKPGWCMVMNVLLGRRGAGEKLFSTPTRSNKAPSSMQISSETVYDSTDQDSSKTPPRNPVAHTRKLLKEWSSPK